MVEEHNNDYNGGCENQNCDETSQGMPLMLQSANISQALPRDGVRTMFFPLGKGYASITLSGIDNIKESVDLLKKHLDLCIEGIEGFEDEPINDDVK